MLRGANNKGSIHPEVIVGGKPVVRGQLVTRKAQDLIETAQILAALTGEDIHPIRADHSHRPGVDPKAGKDALSGTD